MSVPVTKSEADEAKKLAMPAKSDGEPQRPAGVLERTCSGSPGIAARP
ncbi:MAG: hypothetical protein HW379_1249, partial [Actinobacteria bacterium]|nr:hypothetical protein [Actinomycetota bacterium]